MRIFWKHLPAGLQIRYRDTAFQSSLIFHSASICCTCAMFWFVLQYIFSWTFLEFRNWNAPETLKRRGELIANCAVSIQRSWDVFLTSSVRSAIDESPLLLTENKNIYILFISIKTSSVAGLPMPLWAVHLYAPSSCLETMVSGNATMVLS